MSVEAKFRYEKDSENKELNNVSARTNTINIKMLEEKNFGTIKNQIQTRFMVKSFKRYFYFYRFSIMKYTEFT